MIKIGNRRILSTEFVDQKYRVTAIATNIKSNEKTIFKIVDRLMELLSMKVRRIFSDRMNDTCFFKQSDAENLLEVLFEACRHGVFQRTISGIVDKINLQFQFGMLLHKGH